LSPLVSAEFEATFEGGQTMEQKPAGRKPVDVEIERLKIVSWFISPSFWTLPSSHGCMAVCSVDIAAIIGVFISVMGTLVGAFFGVQIGSAGRERDQKAHDDVMFRQSIHIKLHKGIDNKKDLSIIQIRFRLFMNNLIDCWKNILRVCHFSSYKGASLWQR
jgi:hypothetical protein